MVTIKNINPQKTALSVGGQVVEFGAIIDVDRPAAESLTASPNFEKASLADAKASAKSGKVKPQTETKN